MDTQHTPSQQTSQQTSQRETLRALAQSFALAREALDARLAERERAAETLAGLTDEQLFARLTLAQPDMRVYASYTHTQLLSALLDATLPTSELRAALRRAERALGNARPTTARDDAHELMPAWLDAMTPRLYETEHERDPFVWAKFFTPDSSWTWYVTEYHTEDGTCFGLVDGFERELGYFSVDELRSVTGPMGLRIERDVHWTPKRLSVVRAQRG